MPKLPIIPLWQPAGVGDRLDDAELEAILLHELCHTLADANVPASPNCLNVATNPAAHANNLV